MLNVYVYINQSSSEYHLSMPCDVIQCDDILNPVVVWSPRRLLKLNKKTTLLSLQECQEAFCIANRVHVYVNRPELTRNETGAHNVHLELELIWVRGYPFHAQLWLMFGATIHNGTSSSRFPLLILAVRISARR